MRRATGISVAAHGAALALLLGAAFGKAPPLPPVLPPAIAVALASPPKPKPAPAAPAPQKVAQPTPKAPPRPAPVKAASPSPAPAAAPAEAPSPDPTRAPAPAPVVPAPAPAPVATGPDASWLGEVRARLEAAKRYPPAARRLGQEGVAVVSFEVAPDGRVLSRTLATGSGSSHLDREAADLPGRVSLPPMPDSMPRQPVTITVPVRFSLR